MSDFKVIESQEQFDEAIKDRIERAEEKTRKEMSGQIEELKSKLESLIGENENYKEELASLEEKNERISSLEGEIEGYKKADLRRKVAMDNNIPFKLADRIVGDDEESMVEDAKKLAVYFEKKNVETPLRSYDNPNKGDDKTGAYKALLKDLNFEGV